MAPLIFIFIEDFSNMANDIIFANIDWTNINLPRSTIYGDIYFSAAGGEQETIHNFINGNKLKERLCNLENNATFSIAETGFGTGSNLLIFLNCFSKIISEKKLKISFISFEKYPLSESQMRKIHTEYANYQGITEEFLTKYSKLDFNSNKVNLSLNNDQVDVTIYLGDINDRLELFKKSITSPIDAWFLDGFAPSCNPDLWTEELFKTMNLTGKANTTTFATFSVAAEIKRKAISANFKIEKKPGFGTKKEMLTGILETNPS